MLHDPDLEANVRRMAEKLETTMTAFTEAILRQQEKGPQLRLRARQMKGNQITDNQMTDNSVQRFSREGWELRTVEHDGTVLFCARDVAAALGYQNTNKAIKDHCRGVTNRYPTTDSLGRTQDAVFISEGDVYRLIASSKLPKAVEFERWVFDEVLPQIRRTGGYVRVTETDDEKTVLAKAALIAQKTMSEQSRLIENQRRELDRQKPLALLGEAFVGTDGTMSVTQAARHFQTIDRKMTRDMVYGILRGAGYVETRSNAPTCKGIKPGYLVQRRAFKHDGTLTRPYARFTTKGLNWFINRFVYPNTQPRLEGLS